MKKDRQPTILLSRTATSTATPMPRWVGGLLYTVQTPSKEDYRPLHMLIFVVYNLMQVQILRQNPKMMHSPAGVVYGRVAVYIHVLINYSHITKRERLLVQLHVFHLYIYRSTMTSVL